MSVIGIELVDRALKAKRSVGVECSVALEGGTTSLHIYEAKEYENDRGLKKEKEKKYEEK